MKRLEFHIPDDLTTSDLLLRLFFVWTLLGKNFVQPSGWELTVEHLDIGLENILP